MNAGCRMHYDENMYHPQGWQGGPGRMGNFPPHNNMPGPVVSTCVLYRQTYFESSCIAPSTFV